MVSATSAGPATPTELVVVPDTITALSAAYTALSTAVMVTSPVLAVLPAVMVSVRLAESVESSATAGAIGVTATSIVVTASDAMSSVAVTVVTPPFSEMVVEDRSSATTGRTGVVAETGGGALPTPPFSLPLHTPLGVVAATSTPSGVVSVPPHRWNPSRFIDAASIW